MTIHFRKSCQPWRRHLFVLVCGWMLVVHVVHADTSPTCYEYWDAACQTGVKNTFYELTGGNCSLTAADSAPPLGTACLTADLVALTQVEPASCRKTFGSVQAVSTCVPYGRNRNGRNVWMYCTDVGCQDFGQTCTTDQLTRPGRIKVWDSCDENTPDLYVDPVPTNGECYALPEAGASIRLRCLNNLYMQAEVFADLACEQTSPWHGAPTFLQDGVDQCYPFQGTSMGFALRVQQGCRCGEDVGDTTDNGGNNNNNGQDANVLHFDVLYNITVNGTNCMDGNRMTDLELRLAQETEADAVTIDVAKAALFTQGGLKWWDLGLAVRFVAIPEPRILVFQQNVDEALADGRVLQIIKSTCGYDVNVTLVNGGSIVSEHESLTSAPVSGGMSRFQWRETRRGLLLIALGGIVTCFC